MDFSCQQHPPQWSVKRYSPNFGEVLLLEKSAPAMSDIHISNEGVIMMKRLNLSKALGPDELHPRVLKECGRTLYCICSFVPTISLLIRVEYQKE